MSKTISVGTVMPKMPLILEIFAVIFFPSVETAHTSTALSVTTPQESSSMRCSALAMPNAVV